MPDPRLDQLPADASPLSTDLVLVEHDPGGGGQQHRKVTLANLLALIPILDDGTDIDVTLAGNTYTVAVESAFDLIARPIISVATAIDGPFQSRGTLTADATLALAGLAASSKYEIFGQIGYTGSGSGAGGADFAMGWGQPGGAAWALSWQSLALGTAAAASAAVVDRAVYAIGDTAPAGCTSYATSGAGALAAMLYGILTTDTTGGTLTFKWAQNSSTASDTARLAGSFLVARKLS